MVGASLIWSAEPGKILTSLAARCAESTNAMLLFGKVSRYVDPTEIFPPNIPIDLIPYAKSTGL